MRYLPLVLIALFSCTASVKKGQEADSTATADIDSAAIAEQEELEDFNNSDYGDPGKPESFSEYELVVKERNWSNGDDPIPEDQYPGEIRKYFILEDSTEMNAEGYTISNGYPWGTTTPDKSVKAVRFEVTLNRPADLRFEVENYYSDESEYNTHFTKIFNGAEANRPYSVIIGDTPQNTMILCSVMRATIFAGGVTAAATVAGECGD
jgi:hypothetical protein